MSDVTSTARRICLGIGIAFLVFGLVLGLAYYLYYRPMWSPEVLAPAARLLADPATPVEAVRSTALQGHKTLLDGAEALDAAMLLLLIASAAAGVAFVYVFVVLRKGKVDGAL